MRRHDKVIFLNKQFNDWKVISYYGQRKVTKDQTTAFYICECKCGKRKSLRATVIKHGRSKCCGCRKRMSPGEGAKRGIYKNYKLNAKLRGVEFKISLEEFSKITTKNCYYCGSKPKTVTNFNKVFGQYTYNGMDRIDNTKGYNIANVITCCKYCNYAKHDLTQTEFYTLVALIYERHCA